MPDLGFQVKYADPVPFAAAPEIVFTLSAHNEPPHESIHNVQLMAQIRIETNRRSYDPHEKDRLTGLFGEPHRWSQTLRPMLWAHASAVVPPFSGDTTFELHVPCTFDFSIAATQYFDALSQGEIPLLFLFSGTIFYADDSGLLQVSRISWSKDANFRLPVETWRGLMDAYYPNSAWLNLRKDIFDRLRKYRSQNGLASWEQAFEKLLVDAGAPPNRETLVQ